MMDIQGWHRTALASPIRRPKPVGASGRKQMSENQVELYVDRVDMWLSCQFVPTHDSDPVTKALNRGLRRNARSLPGAKDILCLTGPNAVGKSTLTTRWAADLYRQWTKDAPIGGDGLPSWRPNDSISGALYAPLVRITLQAGAQIKAFDKQILDFLGINSAGSAADLTSRVIKAIAAHGIRLLIVDDVHLLKMTAKLGKEVLDHIKHINTELGELGGSLVLIGANLGGGQIVSDPQIAGRLRLQSIKPMGATSCDEALIWQRQLKELEALVLPYVPSSGAGVFSQRFAPLIWRRTQGHIGDVAVLLREACALAIDDGSLSVTEAHLMDVELSDRAEKEERERYRGRSAGKAAA